jgi:uncharacterized membrane protein YgcG
MAYGRRDRHADRNRNDVPPLEGQAYITEDQPAEQATVIVEPRKPHKKISWVAAMVAGLVVVFVVAVLLLATLFTNYRRGTKLEKVIHGSEKIEVNIYTTEETMKNNGVDLLDSENRIQQVLSEMGVPIENVNVTIYLTDRMTQPQNQSTTPGSSSSSNSGSGGGSSGTSSSNGGSTPSSTPSTGQ